VKETNSYINKASIVGVVYLFLSFNPFILWLLPAIGVFVFITIITIWVFYLLLSNRLLAVSLKKIIFIFLFIPFTIYITLHFASNDLVLWKFIYFIPLYFIVFFPDKVFVNIFMLFRKLIVFFSYLSIIVFFLVFFNVDLPFYRIDLRPDSFFKIYGLVVSSSNTVFELYGFTIARVCGPFLEPGHFGIYIGITLSIEKVFLNRISKVPIIAGVLTFSPAFYIIFILIILYDLVTQKRIKLLIISAVSFITIFTFVITNNQIKDALFYIAVGRNIDESGKIDLDNRAGTWASYAWDNFIDNGDIIFGNGFRSLDEIGALADYRGIIFRFGILGFIWSILLILFFVFNYNKGNWILIIPIIIIVYLHRSWMFDSAYIYILMLCALSTERFYLHNNESISYE
jgi:hypothetical protein